MKSKMGTTRERRGRDKRIDQEEEKSGFSEADSLNDRRGQVLPTLG